MTPGQEKAFDKFEENHFKSHRELPNGRDFRFNHEYKKSEDDNFKSNFDTIFPNAPGAGI